jgi:protein tyrosine/serine phosphatase
MIKNGIITTGGAESVNFREIRMGNIAPNILYRGSHPIKDNKQEKIISLLAAQARIAAVLNLSDTSSNIKLKSVFAPWYNKLFKNNRVIGLGMDFNNNSENFRKKLKKGLQFIINTEGPWLIHCHAGVDRTGFVSIVLEALMGAALNEIINDYLQSFNSIYDSSIYGEVNKGDSLVVMQLLSAMGNYLPVNDQNLQAIAENYLLSTIKLTVGEIELLKSKLALYDRAV